MGVKLMITGRRRVGQTLAAHRHHMKNVHGKLVLDFIAAAPMDAPRRYVQNHVFDGSFGREAAARDFVTELWFEDAAGVGASRQTAFYQAHLAPDEPNMVDDASVHGMVTREVPHVLGTRGPIKVIVQHRAAPGLTRADFDQGWAAQAAPKEYPHTRCHPLSAGPIDGVDIFWLPDTAAADAFSMGAALSLCTALEQRGFCAVGTSTILIAQEHVLFAGAQSLAAGQG